eukprot:COSAG06_NODE_33551_length_488_cov_0.552699_1_plen_104_part_01
MGAAARPRLRTALLAALLAGGATQPAPEPDDTALLDSLAERGGAIQLEPRAYHRVGTWVIATNNTVVKGWGAGVTRIFVHAAKNVTEATCVPGPLDPPPPPPPP